MHPVLLYLADALTTRQDAVPGGPKGPPSAPPAIPPIIINPLNPFSKHVPEPSIDPVRTPVGPPVAPPGRPGFYLAHAPT